jgi:cation diffusion facilitator family transporter
MSQPKAERGLKTTLVGITVNFLLALTKGTAGVLGNSFALIADAIESTSDIFSSTLVYIGLRVSAKPRDKNHPYGHGKAEPIVAIVVTLALFAAAVVIIVESISEILTPHHAPEPFTLLVLVLVVVTKETLFRVVNKVGKEIQSTAVKTDSWHHRSDAITSAAAFVGILIAVIGGKGWESADDWAALAASGIIITNAILLFLPALNEIMDAAPEGNIHERILEIARGVNAVHDTEKCLVRKMGLQFIVELHILVDGALSVREGHSIAHEVKSRLVASELDVLDVIVHVEPWDSLKR